MTRKIATLAALVVASSAVAACSSATAPSTASTAAAVKGAAVAAEDPNTVVATVNGEPITLADVDKPMQGRIRALEQQLREQKHQLRQASLDSLVVQKLVQAEAKKRNMTEEELLRAEIEAKVAPPTDEEVQAFYDQNRGATGLPPFEQAKDQIAQYLTADRQRKAAFEYFEKLKAGAKIETNLPEPAAPKVDVAAVGPSKGAADAPVTIVAFSDFECPFCARVNPTIEKLLQAYEGKVRFVFRDFPLPFHPRAPKASEAAHCAHEQGKFWEMHDVLFANQKKLEVEDLKAHAATIQGLDQEKFAACLDSGKHAETVRKNMEAGEEAGVQGTPAFFVNGTPLSGALPFEEFQKVIDRELAALGASASK